MEIIIGRDIQTGQLRLVIDGQEQLTGTSNSVPVSVAPQHCKILLQNGLLRLQNWDVNNYTYVNGQSIESKAVTLNDQLTLGREQYLLDWNLLREVIPADIRPLKNVWENYEQQNIDLQIAERKFNTLRSMTGLITMVAIVLSIATGGRSKWYILLYGIAIVASLLFFIKAYRDSSKIPQKRQELNRRFQHDYVCPHCGHFLGNQSYDIMAQNSHCPYCKKQFIR